MKGIGYLKFSVLSLFTLGIGYFGLLKSSYVNGYQLLTVGLDNVQSNWNSQYHIGVLKKSRFMSNYLGTTKNVLALDNQNLIFRGPDNGLYVYTNEWQGYFDYYRSCDQISSEGTGDSILQNCGSTMGGAMNDEVIGNFLKEIQAGDYVYVNLEKKRMTCGQWCSSNYRFADVCFSSETFGSTLCFVGNSYDYGSNLRALSGSLGLDNNITFGNINRGILSEPPFFVAGENVVGGSNVVGGTDLTGDLLYNTCTNGYILTQIDKEFGGTWRYTCNAGINDTGTILDQSSMINLVNVPGQGVDFKTVYALTKDGMSWNTWFQTYSNLFNNWFYNQNVYQTNPFYGKNAVLFSYFKILNDYGFNDIVYSYEILNGCKLLLYSDWNAEYDGSYFSSMCGAYGNYNEGGTTTTGEVGSVEDNNEVLPPGYDVGGGSSTSSGNIIGSDWSGITSGTQKKYDGSTFINDFFQKVKTTYVKPSRSELGLGTLPVYIITFMCALILFRFLSH